MVTTHMLFVHDMQGLQGRLQQASLQAREGIKTPAGYFAQDRHASLSILKTYLQA